MQGIPLQRPCALNRSLLINRLPKRVRRTRAFGPMLLLAMGLTLTGCQTAGVDSARNPDPADPMAAGPATIQYRSGFEAYSPMAPDKAVPWRESNDRVHEIGGWRVYAREPQNEASAPAGTQAPEAHGTPAKPAVTPPASTPASGHRH